MLRDHSFVQIGRWAAIQQKSMTLCVGTQGADATLDQSRSVKAALEGRCFWRQRMKVIIDEAGEIIAKATDDHTLIGGHHRLSQAASLGKRLFWRETGEPVKLDHFFKHHGSTLRHTG